MLKSKFKSLTVKKNTAFKKKLVACQQDQELETQIFNQQDAFLQIEQTYRELCKEYNIFERVNIEQISEETNTDGCDIAMSSKELERKIQENFDEKMQKIKKINMVMASQTNQFRKVDSELNQDMELLKNSFYHFDLERLERKEIKIENLEENIQKKQLSKILERMERIKNRNVGASERNNSQKILCRHKSLDLIQSKMMQSERVPKIKMENYEDSKRGYIKKINNYT